MGKDHGYRNTEVEATVSWWIDGLEDDIVKN